MLENGAWVTTDAVGSHRGYHLNQLYAPYRWVTWAQILKEQREAKLDVEKLIVFTNTTLAETYKELGASADAETVKRKCVRDYPCGELWDDTIAVTMAVDCQSDRVEYEIKGWLPKLCSYSVDYGVIDGAIGNQKTMEELSEIINFEWKNSKSNTTVNISRVLIDSGYDTADVYLFCKRFRSNFVSPIKGTELLDVPFTTPKYVEIKKHGKRVSQQGITLIQVGSSMLKKQIYNHLNMPQEDYDNDGVWRKMFFPRAYSDEYYQQLCAERLIKEYGKGTSNKSYKYVWKKLRERNEALDLNVYNLAAAYMLKLQKYDTQTARKPTKKVKRRVESSMDFNL